MRGGLWTEHLVPSWHDAMIALYAEFGDRWRIEPRDYLDGPKLAAWPRPDDPLFIPIARTTPEAMAEALREHELAEGERARR
jgi:hypothetical protein